VYVAPKSEIESRAHYAPAPEWGQRIHSNEQTKCEKFSNMYRVKNHAIYWK